MSLSSMTVKLRGSLGRDAEVPTSGAVNDDSCAVLALLIESIVSDKPTGLQIARRLLIPIACPGSHFCGVNRDMKEGDSIEVEGELHRCECDGPAIWTREPRVMRIAGMKVRATRVIKIDRNDEGDVS